ncbi:unnamed protein product [Peronospora belbahrii]|uniref:Uncharacterized protein n=1 Tax=Peronospora belbahrii TaxID=622444 RepID=A0AAU9KX54_9STRA|nr:unnamed protein product [Peronospora belbahrii]
MPDAKAVKALESNVELLSRSLFATTDTSAKRNLRRTKNNASPDGEERGIDAANWMTSPPTYPRAVPRSHIINTRYLSNSHTKLCNFYGHE